MNENDAVRRFLRERGCPDELVAGGLDVLIAEWERFVTEVEQVYSLGLDDYLNDLDTRQLLEEVLPLVPEREREPARRRIQAADERLKRSVVPTDECLWGESVAEAEDWTPTENWWYFRLPRTPGPLLREDLKGGI